MQFNATLLFSARALLFQIFILKGIKLSSESEKNVYVKIDSASIPELEIVEPNKDGTSEQRLSR